ncbi:hypothetical protein [Streptomyces sp. NBC_01304]|uniref:hypothetical protein n=1 Tax=Streptomyces sp. NBC_01304 TaxID=2903818 RepID=UPI002E10037E|nr:hypothetical protein OG430_42005 [Streptomyces sp. NBC_01304]
MADEGKFDLAVVGAGPAGAVALLARSATTLILPIAIALIQLLGSKDRPDLQSELSLDPPREF